MPSLFLKSDRSGHVCITSREVYRFIFDGQTWRCEFTVGRIECFALDAANHPERTFGALTGAQAQILS